MGKHSSGQGPGVYRGEVTGELHDSDDSLNGAHPSCGIPELRVVASFWAAKFAFLLTVTKERCKTGCPSARVIRVGFAMDASVAQQTWELENNVEKIQDADSIYRYDDSEQVPTIFA